MRPGPSLLLITLCFHPVLAQTMRAILVDGDGPWRDDRWAFAATEFSCLLSDAGYTVTTVSPADLPATFGAPDILLAVPSLERLPFDAVIAVANHRGLGRKRDGQWWRALPRAALSHARRQMARCGGI